jgi:hypothetical protein
VRLCEDGLADALRHGAGGCAWWAIERHESIVLPGADGIGWENSFPTNRFRADPQALWSSAIAARVENAARIQRFARSGAL